MAIGTVLIMLFPFSSVKVGILPISRISNAVQQSKVTQLKCLADRQWLLNSFCFPFWVYFVFHFLLFIVAEGIRLLLKILFVQR